jgi:hypothetical protein
MSIEIGDNYIYSRDIDREIDDLQTMLAGTPFEDNSFHWPKLEELLIEEWFNATNTSMDDATRLISLLRFRDEAQECTREWIYGAQFVLEDKFTEYARQIAEETRMVDLNSNMSNYIDWEVFAHDLKMDYSEFTFEGYTYLTRS